MDNDDFSTMVKTLLENKDIDPAIARQLLVAITIYTRAQLHENKRTCTTNHNHLAELIQQQTDNITQLTTLIQQHETYIQTHPSIIYLLRFKTKETVATIVFLIVVLSLWYVSGMRQPILKFLGLPVF